MLTTAHWVCWVPELSWSCTLACGYLQASGIVELEEGDSVVMLKRRRADKASVYDDQVWDNCCCKWLWQHACMRDRPLLSQCSTVP